MSHNPTVCDECGEIYDPGGSPHDCPGTARDLANRVSELEVDNEDLGDRILDLEAAVEELQEGKKKTTTERLLRECKDVAETVVGDDDVVTVCINYVGGWEVWIEASSEGTDGSIRSRSLFDAEGVGEDDDRLDEALGRLLEFLRQRAKS